jgi:hypothetical protein
MDDVGVGEGRGGNGGGGVVGGVARGSPGGSGESGDTGDPDGCPSSVMQATRIPIAIKGNKRITLISRFLIEQSTFRIVLSVYLLHAVCSKKVHRCVKLQI